MTSDRIGTSEPETPRPATKAVTIVLDYWEVEVLYEYWVLETLSELSSTLLVGACDYSWYRSTSRRRDYLESLMDPDGAAKIRYESYFKYRKYMGEGGFRLMTEGSHESQAMELPKGWNTGGSESSKPELPSCKQDIAYRHSKMSNATLRDEAVAFLRSNPEGMFVDPDGDRWHLEECLAPDDYLDDDEWAHDQLDRDECGQGEENLSFTDPDANQSHWDACGEQKADLQYILVLTLRTAKYGVSTTFTTYMRRPPDWTGPRFALPEGWEAF
jgi:hypothetical protein